MARGLSSSIIPGTLKALRQEALGLLGEAQAILILANQITPHKNHEFAEGRALVEACQSQKQMKEHIR